LKWCELESYVTSRLIWQGEAEGQTLKPNSRQYEKPYPTSHSTG
jgi:hypothetical protein